MSTVQTSASTPAKPPMLYVVAVTATLMLTILFLALILFAVAWTAALGLLYLLHLLFGTPAPRPTL